jgi:hypothetical protein
MTHMAIAAPPRRIVRRAAQIPIVALLLLLGACAQGCAPTTRASTINATKAAYEVSASALTSYSTEHQETIVDQATSAEDGKAKLAAFRAKRDQARKALAIASAAIAVAAALNDDPSLVGMQKAMQQVLDAFIQLTQGAP